MRRLTPLRKSIDCSGEKQSDFAKRPKGVNKLPGWRSKSASGQLTSAADLKAGGIGLAAMPTN